ncbi:MAG TPA: hypothetical protein VK921_04175, partial [Anditalea sp.]|nr:hypothetical protein [Anditalea sp.]
MPKHLIILFFGLLFINFQANAQNAEQTSNPNMTTPWFDQVTDQPHQEYPRPQMARDNWVNLNGKWEYAIIDKTAGMPEKFDGQIMVPFAVESKLSGVEKRVGKDKQLWYKRTFTVDSKLRSGKLLMHFGAVDWEAEVFINGKSVGKHQGGYDPFYFDISDFLKRGNSQEVMVRVWDPSDDGPQPRGKQVKNPNSIWYTPVTGIWQTVWLEPVPDNYISSIKTTPNYDASKITIRPEISGTSGLQVKVKLLDGVNTVAEQTSSEGGEIELAISNPKHWSPSDPFLYDIEISLFKGSREIDKVNSYTALRKISMAVDADGIQRMMLNNEFLFQYGPLDQGWWPDGLYTAPNEEALVFDIKKTQDMGFNMIRKHVKVEPARWYYHCDKMGMLVWQDMPNGDHGNHWESRPGITGKGTEKDRTSESEEIFRTEWKAIMD